MKKTTRNTRKAQMPMGGRRAGLVHEARVRACQHCTSVHLPSRKDVMECIGAGLHALHCEQNVKT